MRVICAALLTIFSPLSFGCIHLELGTPKQSDMVDCREGYAIGYNYQLKSAEWVAYKLESQPEGEGVDRTDDFRVDPKIPAEFQTTPDDYDEPVYHQGHLANSESIDTSVVAISENGILKGLENRERKWANKRSSIFVYAGPLYIGQIEHIGANQVPVPSHLWKAIYDPEKNEAITYVIEHKPLYTRDLDKYLKSVDYIEALAGIDLLSQLEDSVETSIELIVQPKQWK